MMHNPWKKRREEERQKLEEAERLRQRIEQQWDFIRDQVRLSRKHQRENHIVQLVLGVARGHRP